MPIFGPPLPCPPVFKNHQEFRDFLLVKCKCILKGLGQAILGNFSIDHMVTELTEITK